MGAQWVQHPDEVLGVKGPWGKRSSRGARPRCYSLGFQAGVTLVATVGRARRENGVQGSQPGSGSLRGGGDHRPTGLRRAWLCRSEQVVWNVHVDAPRSSCGWTPGLWHPREAPSSCSHWAVSLWTPEHGLANRNPPLGPSKCDLFLC